MGQIIYPGPHASVDVYLSTGVVTLLRNVQYVVPDVDEVKLLGQGWLPGDDGVPSIMPPVPTTPVWRQAAVNVRGATDGARVVFDGASESGFSLSVESGSKALDWAPSTAYAANQIVRAPDGTLQRAIADHTSGASFNPANWTLLGGVNNLQVKKARRGGIQPVTLRTPTLAIQGEWPNENQDYIILWAQGITAYAVGSDFSIRKTTNGGYTWTRKNTAVLPYQLGYRGAFLKTQANTLLAFENSGSSPVVRRSTDDGVTWSSAVLTMRSGYIVLSPQSWCQDPNTGYLYVGEYTPDDTKTDVKVYRSTDDGATWSEFYTFNGPASANSNRIRHIHACQYDPVSQRVYFMAGDGQTAAGIYRVTADGSSVEPVVLNSQIGTKNGQGGQDVPTARAVAAMFFPNYIAWVSDDLQGVFCRMARSEIGKPTPTVEAVYNSLSSGWGTIRASSDGSTWLASADSDNGANLSDYAAHLYAVTDEGATVWEMGAAAAGPATQSYTGFIPVGQAELHAADSIWLQRSFGAKGDTAGSPSPWAVRAVLTNSLTDLAPRRRWRRRYHPPATVSSGVINLAAGQTQAFGRTVAPDNDTFLYILDFNVWRISGTGTLALQFIRTDTSGTVTGPQGNTAQFRTGLRADDEYLTSVNLPAGTAVEFRLSETGGSQAVVATGFVTFAWGPPQVQGGLF